MRESLVRRWRVAAVLGAILLLCACTTRSISNSGYAAGGDRGNPFYRGELSEFDVLGIDLGAPVSEAEIARELDRRQRVGVRKGATIMLIQSGAAIPDHQMVTALDRHFSAVPFSGVPLATAGRLTGADTPVATYARALRLAAAKSGADIIFCYWGVLESAVEREATKAVSWVPIIGAVVPDETQSMRIRLKVAVIDVRSGQWSMFAPEAYLDAALSASLSRAASDRRQVELLKDKAYNAAVDAFVARYAS
jgi:hypothetical protein